MGLGVFPEYLDALEAGPCAPTSGPAAPGAVRTYVMDERGAEDERQPRTDIEAMAAIVREGIRAGPWGTWAPMSPGRSAR